MNNLKVYITSDKIKIKVKELAAKISFDYKGKITLDKPLYAICVLKGGVMFYCELLKSLNIPVNMCFVTLSSYKNNTYSSGSVEPVSIILPNLDGQNVLVVDDIIDTGYTLDYFIKYLKNTYKLESCKTACLSDKFETRKNGFMPDYASFKIDNKFVVGFGMDYKGLYRNLDYIAYIESEE